eukprot:GDKJ01003415.1.p1 GENE.GDKJ01003415.1~~GDKJ01003415.1.p1  ORF type:complete len:606 (+),score=228.69 GDKJ01003415.1:50-1819(+)
MNNNNTSSNNNSNNPLTFNSHQVFNTTTPSSNANNSLTNHSSSNCGPPTLPPSIKNPQPFSNQSPHFTPLQLASNHTLQQQQQPSNNTTTSRMESKSNKSNVFPSTYQFNNSSVPSHFQSSPFLDPSVSSAPFDNHSLFDGFSPHLNQQQQQVASLHSGSASSSLKYQFPHHTLHQYAMSNASNSTPLQTPLSNKHFVLHQKANTIANGYSYPATTSNFMNGSQISSSVGVPPPLVNSMTRNFDSFPNRVMSNQLPSPSQHQMVTFADASEDEPQIEHEKESESTPLLSSGTHSRGSAFHPLTSAAQSSDLLPAFSANTANTANGHLSTPSPNLQTASNLLKSSTNQANKFSSHSNSAALSGSLPSPVGHQLHFILNPSHSAHSHLILNSNNSSVFNNQSQLTLNNSLHNHTINNNGLNYNNNNNTSSSHNSMFLMPSANSNFFSSSACGGMANSSSVVTASSIPNFDELNNGSTMPPSASQPKNINNSNNHNNTANNNTNHSHNHFMNSNINNTNQNMLSCPISASAGTSQSLHNHMQNQSISSNNFSSKSAPNNYLVTANSQQSQTNEQNFATKSLPQSQHQSFVHF